MKMMREEDKLLEDIKNFEQQLWKACYLDYQKIKNYGIKIVDFYDRHL
jgi:hypothetical protein